MSTKETRIHEAATSRGLPGRGGLPHLFRQEMLGEDSFFASELHMYERARAQQIQAKMQVNAPGDALEDEADQAAEVVLNGGSPALHRKASVGNDSGGFEVNDKVSETIRRKSGSGQPVTPALRADMEPGFGADLGHAKLHTDEEADRLSRSVNARAFTHGNDIFFRKGEYQPHTRSGKFLLAHELTHTFQQSASLQRTPDIQRAPPDDPEQWIVFTIHWKGTLNADQMIAHIELAIFKRRVYHQWENVKPSYPETRSPIKAKVRLSTLIKELGTFSVTANKTMGGTGGIKTAEDYHRYVRIMEMLTPAQWLDYQKRVTGKTSSLDELEKDIQGYLLAQEERKKEKENRENIANKLFGMESIYDAYKAFKKFERDELAGYNTPGPDGPIWHPPTQDSLDRVSKSRTELTDRLHEAGFTGGIPEFEQYIRDYIVAFRTETVRIADDMLDFYDSKLYKESERYHDDKIVKAVWDQLAPLRASYQRYLRHADVMEREKLREQSRLPGNGHLRSKVPTRRESREAQAGAIEETTLSRQMLDSFSNEYPIFDDSELAPGKRIDKEALAQADEKMLKKLLIDYIDARRDDVNKARADIHSDPEQVFGLDKLMEESYARQGIMKDSIQDKIIRDEISRIKKAKLIKNLLIAIFAIILTVLSFGTGAIAALAGIGAFALSAGLAYQEFADYERQNSAAGAGLLSEEPGLVWVIIAVMGAALDLGAAIKAVSALKGPVQAFNRTGDIAEFTTSVKRLETLGQIDGKIARAMEAAAESRRGTIQAMDELKAALGGKMYAFPGPLADPDVWKATVKLAWYKAKEGVHTFQAFYLELKAQNLVADLSKLSDKELAKLKEAFEEGKNLATAGNPLSGTYTTKIKWAIHDINARPHGKLGYWGERIAQTDPRVEAFEMKINPGNESFYVPHPDGGFVQFENLVTNTLQDGKLVQKVDGSMYHVLDKPEFLRKKVLAEAQRQVAAAQSKGLHVEWLVSDQKAVTQLTTYFSNESINITVKFFPE